MAEKIFIRHFSTQYVDQGGPCGHSYPYTGADDCLCRDGYVIPAYFTTGYSVDYCDPMDDYDHVALCPNYRPCPF